MKIFLPVAAAAAAMASSFIYLTLDEDLHFKKRSLRYMLFIDSDLVQAFPVTEGTATYSYSGGDGPKPPYNGVEIRSRQFPAKAYAFLQHTLPSMSCETQLPLAAKIDLTTQSLSADCSTSNTSVSIYLSKDTAGVYALGLTEYRTDKLLR